MKDNLSEKNKIEKMSLLALVSSSFEAFNSHFLEGYIFLDEEFNKMIDNYRLLKATNAGTSNHFLKKAHSFSNQKIKDLDELHSELKNEIKELNYANNSISGAKYIPMNFFYKVQTLIFNYELLDIEFEKLRYKITKEQHSLK